ncbi:MAG: hypothetical protein WDO74_17090 [Pseudomonadota bacterium]
MSSSHARRQRRANRGSLPTAPGAYMLVRLHDDWCKAPLVPCTCTPTQHYERIESAADLERVAGAERAWRADVRRRLD